MGGKNKSRTKLKKEEGPKINVPLALRLKADFLKIGYSVSQTNMAMAQIMHETSGLNKLKAIENHNYAGVKYTKSLGADVFPSTDYFAPRSEDSAKVKSTGKPIPYAKFQNDEAFIREWAHAAHLDGMIKDNKTGAPLNAADYTEYAHRLKLNHYYQDPEYVYLNGLNHWAAVMQKELPPIRMSQTGISFESGIPGYKRKSAIENYAEDMQPEALPPAVTKLSLKDTPVDTRSMIDIPTMGRQINTLDNTPDSAIGSLISETITVTEMTPVNPEAKKAGYIDLTKMKPGRSVQYISVPGQKPLIKFSDPTKLNETSRKSLKQDIEKHLMNQPQIKNNDTFRSPYHNTPLKHPLSVPLMDSARSGFLPDSINISKPLRKAGTDKVGSISTQGLLPSIDKGLPDYLTGATEMANDPIKKGAASLQNILDGGNNYNEAKPEGNVNAANSDAARTVNINLNTPLIGNFTVSTGDTRTDLYNIKEQVETILLEVLNS